MAFFPIPQESGAALTSLSRYFQLISMNSHAIPVTTMRRDQGHIKNPEQNPKSGFIQAPISSK